jgi:glycosyltransferase involved in cell wall biosynthesis
MKKEFGYVKKEDRKKILLLCDDIRLHSGVATMAREMVVGTSHHFNWFNIGGAIKHPEEGKVFDLSQSINDKVGIEDADVKVLPSSGYGNAELIRKIIKQEKPDAILLFTDPRYWVWLFEMEREIRQTMPILYLNIWDDYPAPLYNKAYYEACDLLMGISKQTVEINKMVLGEAATDKIIRYVPHGINEDTFRPIKDDEEYKQLEVTRERLFEGRDIDFVVFYNSRNIRRKSPGDVILSFRQFCDQIGPEKAKKCALIMHTQAVDKNGTDLYAVREAICDPEYVNVFFSQNKLSPEQMNLVYNIADVTMLISSNEGWGLSLTESMMAGTPIIGNVTGGMQDQMRFVDSKKKWYTPSPDVPSNHMKTYEESGEWAFPVFPTNISMVGSVPTPYIYDDRCDFRDVANTIEEVYNLSLEERQRRGLAGREWVTSDESGMSARMMCENVLSSINETFDKFQPRAAFELFKVETPEPKFVKHKIVY